MTVSQGNVYVAKEAPEVIAVVTAITNGGTHVYYTRIDTDDNDWDSNLCLPVESFEQIFEYLQRD